MKRCILLVVFAYFELISCVPLGQPDRERTLSEDIDDFEELLPAENITALYVRYYAENAQFRALIEHAKSEEFQNFLMEVSRTPELQEVLSYLQDHDLVNRIAEGLYPQAEDDNDNDGIGTLEYTDEDLVNSITSYFDELEALIPVEKARQLFEEKMETSSKFVHFYEAISSQEFKDLVKKVIDLDIVQEKINEAQDLGFDVIHLVKIYEKVLGLPGTFSILFTS